MDKNLDNSIFCTNLFHDFVLSQVGYISYAVKPVLNLLNNTEQRFLLYCNEI